MYSLDIETLVSVLQNRRIQGFLEADLATGGMSGELRRGSILIELREGKVISAVIRDANARILYQGVEALNKIRQIVFSWKLTETSAQGGQEMLTDPNFPALRPLSGPQTQGVRNQPFVPATRPQYIDVGIFIPMRRQDLAPDRLRTLTRQARSIYALVNGTNSIQRIAGLLSLPVPVVFKELQALQDMQLVIISEDPRGA